MLRLPTIAQAQLTPIAASAGLSVLGAVLGCRYPAILTATFCNPDVVLPTVVGVSVRFPPMSISPTREPPPLGTLTVFPATIVGVNVGPIRLMPNEFVPCTSTVEPEAKSMATGTVPPAG
jgi:hypothetical protein